MIVERSRVEHIREPGVLGTVLSVGRVGLHDAIAEVEWDDGSPTFLYGLDKLREVEMEEEVEMDGLCPHGWPYEFCTVCEDEEEAAATNQERP